MADYLDHMLEATMAFGSLLDEHQEKLLIDLIEAERRVPREKRQHFYISHTIGPPGVQLCHDGWKETGRRVFEGDIETLARAELIAKSDVGSGLTGIYVTQSGFALYADLTLRRAEE